MDRVYGLPYTRRPHPSYREPIPAFEMIKDSVTIMRGCFGGCTFCSITAHQGRIIQSRSRGVDPGRSRADGGRARVQGHDQRHRRPDRQHVPDALHAARGRGEVPAAVVRPSDDLQAARHRPRPAGRADAARRAKTPGIKQGARRQRHPHGPGAPTRPSTCDELAAPSRRRAPEGRPRAHRPRRARADEEAGAATTSRSSPSEFDARQRSARARSSTSCRTSSPAIRAATSTR